MPEPPGVPPDHRDRPCASLHSSATDAKETADPFDRNLKARAIERVTKLGVGADLPFIEAKELFDEAAVQERYGLKPGQIADLKALKGDPSDNIPGVTGVGEKTALKLIGEFGSVEQIYRRINEVTPQKLQNTMINS